MLLLAWLPFPSRLFFTACYASGSHEVGAHSRAPSLQSRRPSSFTDTPLQCISPVTECLNRHCCCSNLLAYCVYCTTQQRRRRIREKQYWDRSVKNELDLNQKKTAVQIRRIWATEEEMAAVEERERKRLSNGEREIEWNGFCSERGSNLRTGLLRKFGRIASLTKQHLLRGEFCRR